MMLLDFIKGLFLTPRESEGKAVTIISYGLARVGGLIGLAVNITLAAVLWGKMEPWHKTLCIILASVWTILWVCSVLVYAWHSNELKLKATKDISDRQEEVSVVGATWRRVLNWMRKNKVWEKCEPPVEEPKDIEQMEDALAKLRDSVGIKRPASMPIRNIQQ